MSDFRPSVPRRDDYIKRAFRCFPHIGFKTENVVGDTEIPNVENYATDGKAFFTIELDIGYTSREV